MAKQLPVKKIYIDSKFRRADSVSSSNFKIDLPYSVTFPENAVFYIDDISIPNSFYTVEAGINDKMYFRLTTGGLNTDYVITLDSKNYNGAQFANEIHAKINTATWNQLNTVVYNSQTQNLEISFANFDFQIFTDYELQTITNWSGLPYDKKHLQSINELITNTTQTSNVSSAGVSVKYYLMLTPVRNIYLRSPNLSSFNNIGPNGDESIICKIPVNANYGQMVTHGVTMGSDFHNCSKATWRTIEMVLTDVNNNQLNLHNCNWSCSLIFDISNPNQ